MRDETRRDETNGERVIPRMVGFVDRSLSLRGGHRIATILIGQSHRPHTVVSLGIVDSEWPIARVHA